MVWRGPIPIPIPTPISTPTIPQFSRKIFLYIASYSRGI